jgi:hypothetical protein
MLSFTTRGNFIDFKYTEDVYPYQVHLVLTLHNTSKCITWGYGETATNIDFKIDDLIYNEIPISSIYFDGVVMANQAAFKTGIEAMFPGLAGGGVGSSYLSYVALLTQSGTDAPVATVQDGNTIGNIVWARSVPGEYIGTLNSAFPQGKTILLVNSNTQSVDVGIYFVRLTANTIRVSSVNNGVGEDDWLSETTIKIEVYP